MQNLFSCTLFLHKSESHLSAMVLTLMMNLLLQSECKWAAGSSIKIISLLGHNCFRRRRLGKSLKSKKNEREKNSFFFTPPTILSFLHYHFSTYHKTVCQYIFFRFKILTKDVNESQPTGREKQIRQLRFDVRKMYPISASIYIHPYCVSINSFPARIKSICILEDDVLAHVI